MSVELRDGRQIGLALSGGNALGAYEAGSYEALHERGYLPDVVSGASVGAINGAIIAGNPPAERIARLREFWNQAAQGSAFGFAPLGRRSREIYNKMHAMQTFLIGRPGMFSPRIPGMMSMLPGAPPDVALYDTRPLVATLERVIDFDYLDRALLPLVVSAVDIERGELVCFDTRRQPIRPRHLLASTAFAPAFPPVEIDGRWLGDPGLLCNLPIDALLDPPPASDLLCFAVDLFESRGERPYSIDTSLERAQDIVFSSQSLRTLDARGREHRLRCIIRELSDRLDGDGADRAAAELAREGRDSRVAVVLVAYRPPLHELAAKALEFSRASLDERWASGRDDMEAAIERFESGRATSADHGYAFYDARRERSPQAAGPDARPLSA